MHKRKFLKNATIISAGAALSPLSCAMDTGETAEEPPPTIKNWAGNLTFSAKEYHRPENLQAAKETIVKSNQVKIFGTRHSFSAIADCVSEIISSDGFHQIHEIDKAAQTVEVGAGIRYGELAIKLQQEGFALHNLASLPHISIGGACATATHGSGDTNGNLASVVVAMEILKPNGELITLKKGDQDFDGAVVHLGALGMITKLILRIEPTYQVQQEIFLNLPLIEAQENFDQIFSSGYSVSFFSDYSEDVINQVWIKRRIPNGEENLGPLTDFFGAKKALKDMHPIASVSAENCTEQMGLPGPWHERLPHFKMDFTPSNGEELQSEFFVPRESASEVLGVIQKMSDEITPLLFISEVRSIKGDDMWMSTAYGGDRIAFHFTWKPDGKGVENLLPKLEQALSPYDARPHWGKLFHMKRNRIESLYPRIDDFRDLVHRFDPTRKMQNEYLRSRVI